MPASHTTSESARRSGKAEGIILMLIAAVLVLVLLNAVGRRMLDPVVRHVMATDTVDKVIVRCGEEADRRLRPHMEKAGVTYPPEKIALLIFKVERHLELWAGSGQTWTPVKSYPVLAASGRPGPKLREGDRQVPEGIYRIVGLNPRSRFHLSLELNYPNEFDWQKARQDGRENPGSEIFIHGGAASIGCIAIGDEPIEELFVLVARMWPTDVPVVIAPNDLRRKLAPPAVRGDPPWRRELYELLREELAKYPLKRPK
jgi:hypothetical protein